MGYGYNHYGRQRAYYENPPSETKAQLVDRIERVAARGVTTLTDWERNFLGSLRDSTKKWGRLTAKQHDTFQRIESKTDPANIAARNVWNNGFGDGMREKLKFAAEYYKANPPYFSDAADRILGDDDYIPTEKLYRKMVENKYVQRAMENANSAPLYAVGSMVTVRDSSAARRLSLYQCGKDVLVLEIQQNVMSATKGAREYTVLAIGAAHTMVIEERWLKKKR